MKNVLLALVLLIGPLLAFAVLTLVLWAVWLQFFPPGFSGEFAQVKIGMSESEVIKILGQPDARVSFSEMCLLPGRRSQGQVTLCADMVNPKAELYMTYLREAEWFCAAGLDEVNEVIFGECRGT